MPLAINKGIFVNFKKEEDEFNKVHHSDGEPGPFYDIEDLEDTQYFDEYALTNVFPLDSGKTFSGYEGNEYFTKGRDKSCNDSSHIVHVDISQYHVQKMNVNHLKDNLRKRKTSVRYKNILNEILLTALK